MRKYTIALFLFSLVIFSSWASGDNDSPGRRESASGYPNIKISEVCSSNKSLLFDNEKDSSDWAELQNIGDTPVNLKGLSLSDSIKKPTRFIFPDVVLESGDCLVVFLSGKKKSESWEFHAEFKLEKKGEELFLFDPKLNILDQVSIPSLQPDMVYGRPSPGFEEWAVLGMATPGKPNYIYPLTSGEAVTTPEPSHLPGFYQDGFSLKIETPDAGIQIYYTLDCSEPDLNSILYEDAIDISESLIDENPKLSDYQKNFTYPEKQMQVPRNISRAVVLRYRAFKEGHPPGEVKSLTYWFDEPYPEDVPVISLVTEHGNLTDWRNGIYTTGIVHEEWLVDNEYDHTGSGGNYPANYNQRGAAWEVPADFLLLEPEGAAQTNHSARLKLLGGWSRDFLQKSFEIKFYPRKDDAAGLEYSLFPGLETNDGSGRSVDFFRTIVLRNAGNDWYNTFFRDPFMQSFCDDIGLDTQASRPAYIYLNGEFWGILNMREYFDEAYFNQHYAVPLESDGLSLLEAGSQYFAKIGADEYAEDYQNFLDSLYDLSSVDEDIISKIDHMIDIDNFLDYVICQVYFGNTDWPGNNSRIWKGEPQIPENPFVDGRYRQLVYDTDFGFGIYPWHGGVEGNTLQLILDKNGADWPNPEWSTRLFRVLMKDDTIKEKLLTRYCDIANTVFAPDLVEERISEYEEMYRTLVYHQRERWPYSAGGSVDGWKNNLAVLRYFNENRRRYLDMYYMRAFGIRDKYSLTITSGDTPYTINGLSVDTPVFEGWYFEGAKVEIRTASGESEQYVMDKDYQLEME